MSTALTRFPISKTAALSWRLTGTARSSIPTREIVWCAEWTDARAFLAERFPALAAAPLVECRVCQYENTSTGDFLIDRHPDFDNVWLVGGGSGHGFKHGPAVGEHVCALIDGRAAAEPRFSLETQGPGASPVGVLAPAVARPSHASQSG